MTQKIVLRIEKGGYSKAVFWSLEVRLNEETRETKCTVTKTEPLERPEDTKTWSGILSKNEAKRIWKSLKTHSIYTLPRTDYNSNLSDDCYHLGVTIDVDHTDGTFLHQCPTESCVVVSSVLPTKQEYLRFLNFVEEIVDIGEKASKIPTQEFIKLKWRTREQELAKFPGRDH